MDTQESASLCEFDEVCHVLIIFKAQGSYCSHIACSGCMIMYQNFLLILRVININPDD